MKYGTISGQERDAMTEGEIFVSLYFYDNFEVPPMRIGRFHNEDEALKAAWLFTHNELGGFESDGLEIRFCEVAGGRNAKVFKRYFI